MRPILSNCSSSPMYTKLQSMADGVSDDGVAEIGEFGVGLAAHQAIRSHVVVHVAAVIALHARRAEARRQHQRLHLAGFERAQDPAQSDGAASVAMGLADHFGDQRLLALFVVLLQKFERRLPHLFRRGQLGVDAEVPHQPLPGVGVEMRFELRPHIIMAADQQLLASAALDVPGDGVGDNFEMLHGLVHHAALGRGRHRSRPIRRCGRGESVR